MSFAENPIINAPFDKPAWHFELDDDGQPTGKKLPGRRKSIHVVPVAASRRRGPSQKELALFEEEGGSRVAENACYCTGAILTGGAGCSSASEAVETLIWALFFGPESIFFIKG